MNNEARINRVIEFLNKLQETCSEIGQLQEVLNEMKDSNNNIPDENEGLSTRVRELEDAFYTVNEIVDQLIGNGQFIADTMDNFIDPEIIKNSQGYKDAREMVDKSPRVSLYQWNELKERLKVAGY